MLKLLLMSARQNATLLVSSFTIDPGELFLEAEANIIIWSSMEKSATSELRIRRDPL